MNDPNQTNHVFHPKKAYHDPEFLNSPEAREIRVLCEFTEPAHRFRRKGIRNTIVFFGSTHILPREVAQKNLSILEPTVARHKRLPRPLQQAFERARHDVIMSRYYEDARSLARRLTEWSRGLKGAKGLFTICSGGGPGIMEAANRGVIQGGGPSIGLNISLPMEQTPNPFQTKELSFEFHYFFIRKFWFVYLARALVVFPGGFGTMDELFEVLTLVQTRKTRKEMPIVIYGSEYWKEIINFDALVRRGTIAPNDVKLFHFFDDVEGAFGFLKGELTRLCLDKRR